MLVAAILEQMSLRLGPPASVRYIMQVLCLCTLSMSNSTSVGILNPMVIVTLEMTISHLSWTIRPSCCGFPYAVR